MKTRILAATALLPLLLIIVLLAPGICTAVLFGAMAVIGVYELLWNTGMVKHLRLNIYTMVMAFLVAIWSYFGANRGVAMLGITLFLVALFGEMMHDFEAVQFRDLTLCLFSGLLVPFLLCSLVRIHTMYLGRFMILVPFVAAFLSDTGAYFAGRAFGKHKLAPKVSPNKTIEGVVGGVISAVVGMLIYGLVLRLAFKFRVYFGYALVYGILGSLGGVFGDLCFSVIKRQTGIKDYGNLIPGHGGILDRFDSMMIVGPLMEALLMIIPLAVR